MSPVLVYHTSPFRRRAGILRHGKIFPNEPSAAEPYGVYVYRDDGSWNHPTWNSRTVWTAGRQDVWMIAYIGPIMMDKFVHNGMILLDVADHVTLTTGNAA